jgi:hypothetical protein
VNSSVDTLWTTPNFSAVSDHYPSGNPGQESKGSVEFVVVPHFCSAFLLIEAIGVDPVPDGLAHRAGVSGGDGEVGTQEQNPFQVFC